MQSHARGLLRIGLVLAALACAGCGMPPSARVVRQVSTAELRGAKRFVVWPVERTTVEPSLREEQLAQRFHERLVDVGRKYGLDVAVLDRPTSDGRIVLAPRFVEVQDRAIGMNQTVFTRLEVAVMTPDLRTLEVIQLQHEARAVWGIDCAEAYWPTMDCSRFGVGMDPVAWNALTLGADLADYLRYRSSGDTRAPRG